MKYLITGVVCLFAYVVSHSADLMVMTEDARGWEEGDVVVAFNEAQILNVHAHHQVHPRLMNRTKDNHVQSGQLLEKYLENIKEYKFERLSSTEVRRINLFTNNIDTISHVPNKNGEYINVQLYVDRRLNLKPTQNSMFGTKGAEYWFGGRSSITATRMDLVWDEIEAEKGIVRITTFPFTQNEIKKYVILKVNDMTKDEMYQLMKSSTTLPDGEGEVLKLRENKIDFNKTALTTQQKNKLTNKAQLKDFRLVENGIASNLFK